MRFWAHRRQSGHDLSRNTRYSPVAYCLPMSLHDQSESLPNQPINRVSDNITICWTYNRITTPTGLLTLIRQGAPLRKRVVKGT
jgi:hypothetical protein